MKFNIGDEVTVHSNLSKHGTITTYMSEYKKYGIIFSDTPMYVFSFHEDSLQLYDENASYNIGDIVLHHYKDDCNYSITQKDNCLGTIVSKKVEKLGVEKVQRVRFDSDLCSYNVNIGTLELIKKRAEINVTRVKPKTKRWYVIASYRTDDGPKEIVHHIDELEDLGELIEKGPSFGALNKIEIFYNFDEGKTIEECEDE